MVSRSRKENYTALTHIKGLAKSRDPLAQLNKIILQKQIISLGLDFINWDQWCEHYHFTTDIVY